MPTSLGPAHLLVILVVALVVLGPKRLPEAARQIGRFVAEVRQWSAAVQSEIRDVIDLDAEPAAPPATTPPGATTSSAQPPAEPPAQAPATAEPKPVARPQDVRAGAVSQPADPSPEAARRSAAAEWGLPAPAPAPPPAPQPAGAIPPEWAAPPSSNGDHP